jgi:streptomycin 6-kinase
MILSAYAGQRVTPREGCQTLSKTPDDLIIPAALRASVSRYWQAEGDSWINDLPGQITELCAKWGLKLVQTLPGSSTAFVAAVIRDDATNAVLKVSHPRVRGEAEALTAYAGHSAVLLYASTEHALLLELVRPGVVLREGVFGEEMVAITLYLTGKLWESPPAPNLQRLVDYCDGFVRSGTQIITQRPELDDALARTGLALLKELPRNAPTSVMLHGDLHPGNILSATREPWLAIDPKPLLGDPAYEPIPLILETLQREEGAFNASELVRYINHIGSTLGLCPLRIARWGLARRIDWSLFCFGVGDVEGAQRARDEAELFSRATVVLDHL